MAKIGRNNPCPCGSGIKYKKCCLQKDRDASALQAATRVSVSEEIALLQNSAVEKQETLKSIGVFIFFSNKNGDGWLLELTDMDALQVAKNGEKIDIEIVESPETIEVNWSHNFAIKDRKFTTTAYKDKAVEVHEDAPTHTINSALKKIRKNFSTELLESIHVDSD